MTLQTMEIIVEFTAEKSRTVKKELLSLLWIRKVLLSLGFVWALVSMVSSLTMSWLHLSQAGRDHGKSRPGKHELSHMQSSGDLTNSTFQGCCQSQICVKIWLPVYTTGRRGKSMGSGVSRPRLKSLLVHFQLYDKPSPSLSVLVCKAGPGLGLLWKSNEAVHIT